MSARTRALWIILAATGITSAVAAQHEPGSLEEQGLNRIVPDRIMYAQETLPNLKNWEPYTSVLGTETFLIVSNKFAEDADGVVPDMQSFGLVFQPVDGSPPRFGECFHTDADIPYPAPINHSRQEGNPARVGGDARPGAVMFMTGAETSIQEIPEFQSDNRWRRGSFTYIESARIATVQTFAFDASSGSAVSQCKAFDAVLGRLEEGVTVQEEVTRFGGDVVCLENGNFLMVSDDRSRLFSEKKRVTVAAIVSPNGEVIKDSFLVAESSIWKNVAAHRGGFCIRSFGSLFFHTNDGDLVEERHQSDPTLVYPLSDIPIAFEENRGDQSRLAGHVHIPHVFVVGPVDAYDADGQLIPIERDLWIAAYDSRDRSFAGASHVNELAEELGGSDVTTFRKGLDRADVAVDALYRICVTWEVRISPDAPQQSVARILQYDPESATFRHLTPTFFVFLNHTRGPDDPQMETYRPSVSMTTKEICISAKGIINSENEPGGEPNTFPWTNFYTVFAHPEPLDDPTTPVGGTDRIGPFVRGDANSDASVNISDASYLLNWLFLGGPDLACLAAGDANGDGTPNISDASYILNHLFMGGPTIPAPYSECGYSTRQGDIKLGCDSTEACPQ